MTKEGNGGATGKKGKKAAQEAANMVMFNGAMLYIPSMVQRLDKSEKLKHETDSKLKDLQEEMGEYTQWCVEKSLWAFRCVC